MEKPAFCPAEEKAGGADRCLLPALRKVSGDLPEGYLGAGIRREQAAPKAQDQPLKKPQALNTRRWLEGGWEACPGVLGELPVQRAPPRPPSLHGRAVNEVEAPTAPALPPASCALWPQVPPLPLGRRCKPVSTWEVDVDLTTVVQRAWRCQPCESSSRTQGALRAQGWKSFLGGGRLRSAASFPQRGRPCPKSCYSFSETLNTGSFIHSLTLPVYL